MGYPHGEGRGVEHVKWPGLPSRRSLAPLVFLAPFAVATSLLGFQQTTPTFRSRVDLVELDVSVLDKHRKPVRGLTKGDFTVFEDGKPQTISVFEPVDVPDALPPPVEWMRDVTPDVTTNDAKVTRLWVLAIDDAMIPTDPWFIKATRKIVTDIIDKFGPEDLATIVFTADSRKAQDFTNDRTKLLATLDQFNPGFASWKQGANNRIPPVDGDLHFMIGSVATVLNVMDTLVAVPHSRKALIWVTPGVPYDFEVAASPIKAPNYETGGGLIVSGQDAHLRIEYLTKQIFETARRGNVPVFPIDPGGLGGLAGIAVPAKIPRAMDHMLMTAANTGGHAIVNTNDFTPGINSIFEENKSYYLIGYNPTNTRTDGTVRRLEVKVNREDVEVRTKSEYFAPKPGDGPPKNTSERLARATAAPVAMNELPLRAAVAPFAIPGKANLAAVAIALGVRQPVPEAAATGRVTVSTDLRVTAFNTEGDNKGTQRSTAKVVLRAGAQGDADYEALSRINLPPGRYRLRLAAHLESAAKTGTVMVDVDVPDFNRDAASMSGVVIGATPGRPSAPRDLFQDVLPVLPTAQRLFEKTDRASAVFCLYQLAGKPMAPADVAVRVTDGRGDVLMSDKQTLPVDRFISAQSQTAALPQTPTTGGTRSVPTVPVQRPDQSSPLRAAEFRYALPLERLSPGRYLLTFDVTVGAVKLRRDVQFEMR